MRGMNEKQPVNWHAGASLARKTPIASAGLATASSPAWLGHVLPYVPVETLLPIVAVAIFAGPILGVMSILKTVRWINRRDDPRFAGRPSPPALTYVNSRALRKWLQAAK